MNELAWTVVRRNARLIVPLAIAQTTAYWLLNHFPVRNSTGLPLTPVDEAIPFRLWTVWLYLVLLLAGPMLPLFIQSRQVIRRLIVAYLFCVPPAFLMFLCFPTHYPRPSIAPDRSLTGLAYEWLTSVDTPECSFPSGHILVPALGVWGAWLDRWRTRWLVLGAVVVTAPTILTTKQHYLVDLIGGLAFAAVGSILSSRRTRKRVC